MLHYHWRRVLSQDITVIELVHRQLDETDASLHIAIEKGVVDRSWASVAW